MNILNKFQDGITFKPSIYLFFPSKQKTILTNGQQSFVLSNIPQEVVQALKQIVVGTQLNALASLLPGDRLEKVISLLDSKGVVRPFYENEFKETLFEKQVEFFSDFVDDPNAAQQKLSKQSVCIIGCGGGGNIAAQHLVAAGIKNFILVDDDTVNLTNFNRQFCFSQADVGTPKVEALRNYILARNPDTKVHTRRIRIHSIEDLYKGLEDLEKPDFILCCADTPPILIESWIAQYCIQENVPCMFSGVGVYHGIVGPLLTEKSHMEKFIQHNQELEKRQNESSLKVVSSSISYLNTLIGTLMISDVIKFLSSISQPLSLNATLQYNADKGNLVKIAEW
ncbi:ThiF family adenylyltransferase [Scytonema tolypothrichoides VB-61278]|nr:ThiF family adenylyltransferase [Scytonema tolypothrichoides VB-61278]